MAPWLPQSHDAGAWPCHWERNAKVAAWVQAVPACILGRTHTAISHTSRPNHLILVQKFVLSCVPRPGLRNRAGG